MKRTEPKSISEIIDAAIESAGVGGQIAERRACYVWPDVVGQGVNRHTTRRYVDHGVMHVYLTSAPLRQELGFHRARLVELINQAVGSQAITDIQFH